MQLIYKAGIQLKSKQLKEEAYLKCAVFEQVGSVKFNLRIS